MFTIISGLPGAGKTLHTIANVKKLNDDLKKRNENPRSVYYHGIPLTDEGADSLGWLELNSEQLKNWPEELPSGAILIVDEAQKHWPVRSPSKAIPPELREIETHRHKGVDLIFITQDPTLLDSHARKLANEHTHYIRPHGAKYSKKYHSGSGVVSVNNKSELNSLVVSRVTHPKHVYKLYKSAEVHTHKFRPPKILYFFIIAVLILIAMVFMAKSMLVGNSEVQENNISNLPLSPINNVSDLSPVKDEKSWADLLKPEIKGLPYTAPLYKEKATQVTEVPRIAGCAEFKDVCQCYTQQGSIIHDINNNTCLKRIENAPFDHLLANQRAEREQDGQRVRDEPRTSGRDIAKYEDSQKLLHW